jgi:PAS domain S-box-containing protein
LEKRAQARAVRADSSEETTVSPTEKNWTSAGIRGFGRIDTSMTTENSQRNNRVLIIDDNPSIHADFKKILANAGAGIADLAQASAELFGDAVSSTRKAEFDLTTASQGEEGVGAVREAVKEGKRFAMAFVDVRMPPGWDGIETTGRIWELDPDVQVVLCTAYSDYSWEEITGRLGSTDRLVILKKPFDAVEVLQLASALSEKWGLLQRVKTEFQNLEHVVGERTGQLQSTNVRLQQEITQHQHTEQTLRATQEKLNHFLGKSPAVLYSLKIEKEQLVPAWVSDNFSTLTGKDVQDWYRQAPTLEYVEEGDRGAVAAETKTLLERGCVTMEYRVRRKDGQIRWIRDDMKLLRDAGGGPLEVIGCWTEITEHRLLQDQLRQAQKMESVGQLAGGVAHDFNNLLMVIQGYVEMLLNTEPFSGPVVESLRQVYNAAEKAGNLTRQLLAFSRKQIMQPQELDLNDLVNTVSKLLERTLGETIKVEAHCSEKLPCVFADKSMLDQVIMNLAVNARDAMPKGGELIFTTELHQIEKPNRQKRPEARAGLFACLSVADNGSGIAKEHLSHLFEPFFTTKEVGKGTGLGLATVYGIIKQHNGWIEVESLPEKGTTFRVFLPAASAHSSPGGTPSASPEIRGGQETILIVEDEPAVRGLVRTSLERYGYQVRTAASGAEAIKDWAERLNEIDLLITDVVMPDGVSGWELARQLQIRKPVLKILYMSGYTSSMTAIESGAVRTGKSLFLQKPFKPKKLAEAVRVCLEEIPLAVPPYVGGGLPTGGVRLFA